MSASGAGTGQPKPVGPSNLRLRVLSALVLIPLALLFTWLGGFPFRVFVAVVAVAMIYEWLTITAGRAWGRMHWLTAGLLAAVMLLLAAGLAPGVLLILTVVATVVALAAGRFSGHDHWPPSGILYAGLSGISLAMLRDVDSAGLWAILFLFAVVWMTDIAAYFVGRTIGGVKLAPRISPGKTWSGAIGGAVGGVAAGLLVAIFADVRLSLAVFAGLALLLSVVSQMGDLFESHLKRRYAVKDSSNLIPGHGGVMDRVDGIVAAAIAFYVIGILWSGPSGPAHAFFSAG